MIPIRDAVGLVIKCPDCGAESSVAHAQNRVHPQAMQSEPVRTAYLWFRVDCPRTGKKLFPHDHMVEVIG